MVRSLVATDCFKNVDDALNSLCTRRWGHASTKLHRLVYVAALKECSYLVEIKTDQVRH